MNWTLMYEALIMIKLSQATLEEFAIRYLVEAGCSEKAATSVGRAIVQAEAEGNVICGLFYLPVFKEQLKLKKVDGQACPKILRNEGSSVLVDAAHGFAHPAIELATEALIEAVQENGVAAAGVTRSYNALSLAHHVLKFAREGLIGLCCSNAPASVAPPGGTRPIFGTNPVAFAVPGKNCPTLVIDQSTSLVSKTKLLLCAKRQEEIPADWAQDRDGKPTIDPAAGLAGSLLPFGGQKGSNIGLIVEILAAALTGSSLSAHAASFSGNDSGNPGVGQFILAIDPQRFDGPAFYERIETLTRVFDQSGLRFPGQKFRGRGKAEKDKTVYVDKVLWNELNG